MQIVKSQNHPSAPSGARATGQPSGRHWGRVFACCVIMAAFASAFAPGQENRNTNANGAPNGTVMPGSQRNLVPDANQRMLLNEQQAKKQNFEAVNAARKKLIADESALLLKLATDLKTEVDKTNKDTLSIERDPQGRGHREAGPRREGKDEAVCWGKLRGWTVFLSRNQLSKLLRSRAMRRGMVSSNCRVSRRASSAYSPARWVCVCCWRCQAVRRYADQWAVYVAGGSIDGRFAASGGGTGSHHGGEEGCALSMPSARGRWSPTQTSCSSWPMS